MNFIEKLSITLLAKKTLITTINYIVANKRNMYLHSTDFDTINSKTLHLKTDF